MPWPGHPAPGRSGHARTPARDRDTRRPSLQPTEDHDSAADPPTVRPGRASRADRRRGCGTHTGCTGSSPRIRHLEQLGRSTVGFTVLHPYRTRPAPARYAERRGAPQTLPPGRDESVERESEPIACARSATDAGRTPIRPASTGTSASRHHRVPCRIRQDVHGERVQYLLTRRATGGRSVDVEVRIAAIESRKVVGHRCCHAASFLVPLRRGFENRSASCPSARSLDVDRLPGTFRQHRCIARLR